MAIWRAIFFLRGSLVLVFRRLQKGRPQRKRSAVDLSTDFDIFISYRSDASADVRLVAEALMINGFRVWFAEYNVNIFNRMGFLDEIERGLSRSRKFLFFPSESYFESEICLLELLAAKRNANIWPDHAIAVTEKDTRNIENWQTCSATVDRHADYADAAQLRRLLRELSGFVGKQLSLPTDQLVMAQTDRIYRSFESENRTIRGAFVGWHLMEEALPQEQRPEKWVYRGQGGRLFCSISVRNIGIPEGFSYGSEREKFEEFVGLVRKSAVGAADEVVGVHLVRSFGQSHVATTVDQKIDNIRRRTYALFFDRLSNGDDVYLGIEFIHRGSWKDFLTMMRVAEALVYSFRPVSKKRKRLFRP